MSTNEPRYAIRDDRDLHIALGVEPCNWIELLDRGQQIGSFYMGTHEENLARAEAVVAILNAHEAGANGMPAEEAA